MNLDKVKDMTVIVVGCGEIGKPIARLCAMAYEKVHCIDKADSGHLLTIDNDEMVIMHVCLPGNMENFTSVVCEYVSLFDPYLVIVHSTTKPGVMNTIADVIGSSRIAHSQVHGKHKAGRMLGDMLRHKKFIAADAVEAANAAEHHLKQIGFSDENIIHLPSLVSGELVKILATSLYALLIAYAQEVKRIGKKFNVEFEILSLFKKLETDDFDFTTKTPGVIGGHCLMQNLELLDQVCPNAFSKFIQESNDLYKKENDLQ